MNGPHEDTSCPEIKWGSTCIRASLSSRPARASLSEKSKRVAKGGYPVATMKRGFAGLAAGTHEVRFGGPGRGRTYGQMIKRPFKAILIRV